MSLHSDDEVFGERTQRMLKSETKPRASGVRVLFDFSGCAGPIVEKEGLPTAVIAACNESGVTLLEKPRFRRYPDGTMNAAGDLIESHFSLGTYFDARHVSGEVNMCHESMDNTTLAKKFVECLQRQFRPAHAQVNTHQWKSVD